jgi:transposase
LDKELNPPCTPEIRPIENFWAIIKRRVYSDGFKAKSQESLKRRIRKILREVEKPLFKKLMEKVPMMVRKAARDGLDSFQN